jgi:pimeloyl-ACP methyl ester carboxylesterase
MTDIAHHEADLGDVRLHYVTAGSGEPVVLLHGWPQTWYEWRLLIPLLAERHEVIAPDLRGLGDSSVPASGYDKRTVAGDVYRLVHDVLGHERFNLAGHDWGSPVAYALAAMHPEAVRRLVLIDVGPPHEEIPWGPAWHHLFHNVRDLPEALVAGREEVYFGWFYTNIAHPAHPMPESAVAEYLRTYSQPEHTRAGFEFYRAIAEDTADNTALARKGKLPMPVLAVQSRGPFVLSPDRKATTNSVAESIRPLAEDIREVFVEDSGHWVAEEQPGALADILLEFFGSDA